VGFVFDIQTHVGPSIKQQEPSQKDRFSPLG